MSSRFQEHDERDELTEASNAVVDMVHTADLDAAEAAAHDLLARFPDVHDGYDRLGMVPEARGNYAQAADYYWKAIDVIHTLTRVVENDQSRGDLMTNLLDGRVFIGPCSSESEGLQQPMNISRCILKYEEKTHLLRLGVAKIRTPPSAENFWSVPPTIWEGLSTSQQARGRRFLKKARLGQRHLRPVKRRLSGEGWHLSLAVRANVRRQHGRLRTALPTPVTFSSG